MQQWRNPSQALHEQNDCREFSRIGEDAILLSDSHVHTLYSPDSKMEQAEAICAAIASGVTNGCFTEHMDLGHYMESNIGKGIEVGCIRDTAKQTAAVLSRQNFDFILLSTHCVDGIDCYLPELKRDRDKVTAYKRYLEMVYDSVWMIISLNIMIV